jgi:DNA polymerase-3 subunit epsilon
MSDSLLQLEAFIELDRVRAVRWARTQLTLDNWAILDTETTGLYNAEIVEIAIISNRGEPLLNTLVKPTLTIPAKATSIHGINDDMVATAQTFPEIYPQIVEICKINQV